MTYRVNEKAPLGLNLRSAPQASANRLAVLPFGQIVEEIGERDDMGWVEIRTELQGSAVEGFVNSAYLSLAVTAVVPQVQTALAVHLDPGKQLVTRFNRLLAYHLTERDQPTRDPMASPAIRATQLGTIINWIKVDTSARYHPNPANTYCNIYGTDYCYLGGVYLPRVWWLANAYADLLKGRQVAPIYGKTVAEVNANGLLTWMLEHGKDFGWVRHFNLNDMQNAANEGLVCVIIAQQKIPNRSGHICAVVPETAQFKAIRTGSQVTRPLQSQAGRTNKRYWTPTPWWNDPKYREFGFWVNSN
jgi:hypothetical protein